MTVENWINVVMVIVVMMTAAATLLGPVLAVIVQLRMSQPKPIPDVNQPTDHRSRFQRFVVSSPFRYGLWLVAIVGWGVSVWMFITLPLSRATVSVLVTAAGSFTIQVLGISIDTLGRTVKSLGETTKMLASIAESHQAKIAETIDSAKVPSKPKPPNVHS